MMFAFRLLPSSSRPAHSSRYSRIFLRLQISGEFVHHLTGGRAFERHVRPDRTRLVLPCHGLAIDNKVVELDNKVVDLILCMKAPKCTLAATRSCTSEELAEIIVAIPPRTYSSPTFSSVQTTLSADSVSFSPIPRAL